MSIAKALYNNDSLSAERAMLNHLENSEEGYTAINILNSSNNINIY